MVQRDIIWISLESVRQDHTTLGGHERDTTPNLARLAGEPGGAVFENCFSHGIWTRTSSTSILTGRAPSDHGVLAFDSSWVRTSRRFRNSSLRRATGRPVSPPSHR
ncbi:sulfatase-like hydrolase/transferase [Halomicroarcula sp. GCM10025710]